MTEAYATAIAQLTAERDAAQARANAAERQWEAIAMTPDGGWHVAYERAAAQLAEVTAERDSLRAQLEAVTTQRDHMRSVVPELEAQLAHWKGRFVEPRTLTPYDSLGADKWLPELNRAERERTEAQNRADAAEKERDDLAQKLSGNWIEREVDARVMSDFKEQTGPVAFERNQLRDELAQLRAKHEQAVTELNAGYDTLYDELTRTKADRDKHEHRATMHERDADESSRAVSVLSTIIRASVEAIARGVK